MLVHASSHPIRIGALVAGADGAEVATASTRFGFPLGAAFQIQDDLLNLIGRRGPYGKEIGGDLWEGKRTLMLIHALRQGTADERERLGRVFTIDRDRRTEKDVEWVFRLFGRRTAASTWHRPRLTCNGGGRAGRVRTSRRP